jgi:hypothetical protein
MTRRLALLLVSFASVAIALGSACSQPAPDARVVEATPDTASFPAVAMVLIHSCGSLDCHGTVGRNLRLYGDTALRYAPTDVPSVLLPTTGDEVTQDYASVVGLEPEIMSQVVASGGASPERLTFVRKARGTESHVGGAVVVGGDPRDTCITTWLAGRADPAVCAAALDLP